jgi:hypothetical protein
MFKRLSAVAAAILLIKCIFYFLDSLPQFYGGDSISYLNTAPEVWIPPDRSFVYGLFIRHIENWSHSLTPLIVLQVVAGFIVCLLLYYCANQVLNMSHSLSFALACLLAADPAQLLYERQIMAEALGGLFFAAALTLSLSYLKTPRAWKCLLIPPFGLLATAFRLNFYAFAWLLCIGLPLLAWGGEFLRRRSRSDASAAVPPQSAWARYRLLAHLVLSVACFLVILNQYTHYYGRLAHREHAVTYTQGFFMLSGLWSVVIPEDAPDPRLAKIIATKVTFWPGNNPVLERNSQRYGQNGLVSRWENTPIEGPASLHDDIAKRTALNAIKRAPFRVLQETLSNYREYFVDIKLRVLEIFDAQMPITEVQCRFLKEHFGLNVTADWKDRPAVTKVLLMKCRWWLFVLVLSPLWGLSAAIILRKSSHFLPLLLISAAGVLVFLPGCVFVVTNARFLHPLDFGVFLMLGMIVSNAAECIRSR